MPDYEVTDPKSGKTLVVSGATPPTEAELTEIFSQFDTAAPSTPKATTPATDTPAPWSMDMLAQTAKRTADPAIGALKGAANTAIGLGEAAYRYVPGVAAVSDAVGDVIAPDTKPGAAAFTAARESVQPSNAAQQAGYTVEQVGEFFLPVGHTKKAKAALEIARSGGLALAQSGSPAIAGVTAALTAAVPGAGAAKRAASKLQAGAEKTVAQALGATKEWAKSEAGKLAPEMLARGVKGSRAAMYEQAVSKSQSAGRRLGALYTTAAQGGATVPGLALRGELQFAKDGLMVTGRSGQPVPIAGAERVIKKLDALETFVEKLGDDVPLDKAAKIKTAWDRIVAKAGLYGPKAAANATDAADAWAIREGAGALRTLMQSANQDIAALSKEYAFWKGLKDVLKATELRTQAQSGGLQAAIGATTGGLSGMATGDSVGQSLTNAFVGAAAGRQFVKLVQSPWWRTAVSGPLKAEMAKALATGSKGHATSVMGRILSALPAQAKQAIAN